MMSIAFFSLISLSLFMIHEFDEIIFIRPWIEAQGNNPDYQQEMFISGKSHYSSTESIAFMIGEEFLLASLLLFAAAYFTLPELAAAVLIGHLLHLLAHIKEAVQFRRFVPGSFTALVTFPILCLCLIFFLLNHPIHYVLLVILTPLVFALIIGNLTLLHSKTNQVDAWIKRLVS